MHHGITHLDPGRPAVDQQPASLALKCRQQCPCLFNIALIQVQGGGQLAFEVLSHLAHLRVVGALHQERGGAEDFGLQMRVGKEVLRVGSKQLRLALVRPLRRQPAGQAVGMLSQCADARLIGLEDARCEHGLRRAALQQVAGEADKLLQFRTLNRNHQAGVGAELPGALGQ
jgi:hypothetical protein